MQYASQRLYYFVFLYRRALSLLISFGLSPPLTPYLQLVLLYYLSYLTLVYLGKSEPMQYRFDRRLDMFNEFMVGISTIMLFT